MKKIILVLVAIIISTAYLTSLRAQQATLSSGSGVRTSLSFVPFDPIGQKLKDIMVGRLARSKVIALLPDSPDSSMNARFRIRIQSEAIGMREQLCEPLGLRDTDKATATAVSFIYETNCGPGRTHEAGDGLVVCTKSDVEKCADRILRAAENNARVVDQSCSR